MSEENYNKARELVSGYVDEYHQMIYWHVVRRCGAPRDIAQDTMQELWLYSMNQIILGRRKEMVPSFLFWKATRICFDIYRRNGRFVPLGNSPYSMLSEDEAEEKNEAAIDEMVRQQYEADRSSSDFVMDSRHPEPLSEEAETELFQRFWETYDDVDLNQEKKEIAFEIFRKGHTLKEISQERGIPISTLSDWKREITDEVHAAHYRLDTKETNQ